MCTVMAAAIASSVSSCYMHRNLAIDCHHYMPEAVLILTKIKEDINFTACDFNIYCR